MSASTFAGAVEASFSNVAVDVEGFSGKVVPNLGVEGAHVFLTGRCSDDICERVDVDKFSVGALQKFVPRSG
eukprot:686813-Pyramimonas_sp.AAC.1